MRRASPRRGQRRGAGPQGGPGPGHVLPALPGPRRPGGRRLRRGRTGRG
ncbi:hypothetical protein OG741_28635 [Streptomyces sp. NBC_01410]